MVIGEGYAEVKGDITFLVIFHILTSFNIWETAFAIAKRVGSYARYRERWIPAFAGMTACGGVGYSITRV